MPSLKLNLLYGFLRLTGMRKKLEQKFVNPDPRNRNWVRLSEKLLDGATSDEFEMDGRYTTIINPKKQTSDWHIIFYHGGAYVSEPSPLTQPLFAKFANALGVRVSVVDYPLAPENTYKETHDWVLRNYKELTTRVKGEVVLAGDSAGGGLALALAHVIRDNNILPKPKKLLLVSPWVDLEDHFDLPESAFKKDYFLTQHGMEVAAKAYSGGDDRKQSILSPIHGDLSTLGEIAVWYGSDEMLDRQITNFVKKAKAEKVNITAYREKGQQHDFVMVNSPEQQQFFKEAKSFLGLG